MQIGVLEDDPAVRGLLKEMGELVGHEVSVYGHPWDMLLDIFNVDDPRVPFDALIVDLLLPELDGSMVIHKMKSEFPQLPIFVISALSKAQLDMVKNQYPDVKIFQKPFSLSRLLTTLEQTH